MSKKMSLLSEYKNEPECPDVIGRSQDDEDYVFDSDNLDLDKRSKTTLIYHQRHSFCTGGEGQITVSLFESINAGSRGGIIIKITAKGESQWFLPFSKNIENGIELHMAGQIEGGQLGYVLTQAFEDKSK